MWLMGVSTSGTIAARCKALATTVIIAAVLACTPKPIAPHQADGGFTPSNSLMRGRASHAATLLPNGKVLLTGGDCEDSGAATAEVYDPAIGASTLTGNMLECRFGHTATLLPTGQVLVVGGVNSMYLSNHRLLSPSMRYTDYRVLSSAELHDPSTSTFTGTGGMAIGRLGHTATLLPDGKVLVAGGSYYLAAEVYDPSTGTFSFAGNMTTLRYYHTATLLSNGKVLLAGGGAGGSRSAELYDPSTGEFSSTGSMLTPRAYHTATLLKDGRVLVTGGVQDFIFEFPTAELYDPSTGEFAPTGAMIASRDGHQATLLPDGRVLITGGLDTYGRFPELASPLSGGEAGIMAPGVDSRVLAPMNLSGVLASTEFYDPSANSFAIPGRMNHNRSSHTATLLMDGRVLIVGGFRGLSGSHRAMLLKSTEFYQ